MTMIKFTCPHCGNTDRLLMEDNGRADDHPHLTLMCAKPCALEDSSIDPEWWKEYDRVSPITCSMQWNPYD